MSPDRRAQDAVSLLARLAAGETSAGEAVDDAIALCEQTNPALNAVIHPRFEEARRDAMSPATGLLSGLPIAVNDLGCAQGGDPPHPGAHAPRPAPDRTTPPTCSVRS